MTLLILVGLALVLAGLVRSRPATAPKAPRVPDHDPAMAAARARLDAARARERALEMSAQADRERRKAMFR